MSEPVKPETIWVRADCVKPYEWAQWCSIEDGRPFANEIVATRRSECGEYLWFMLDSHNFMKVKPDEWLELIPLKGQGG